KCGPPVEDMRIIGLAWPRDALYARIDARVDAMLMAGLVDEVRQLNADGYDCGLPSMSGIGYRQVCAHLRGELSLAAVVSETKTETHRLVRMQETWFRREDPRIMWLDATSSDLYGEALGIAALRT
ncbi:MAG: tRNA (adenosine(37)-N6)-dimethylallyltransferase MiaA, partial [Gemmatimonadaceae bacterium]